MQIWIHAILGFFVIAAWALLVRSNFACWAKIMEDDHVKTASSGLEVVFGLIGGAMIGGFELYKLATWEGNVMGTIWRTVATVVLMTLPIILKMLATHVKGSDSVKLKMLGAELEGVKNQRDWATRVREVIVNVVGEKVTRLRKSYREGRLRDPSRLVDSMDPQVQIHQILLVFHMTFQKALSNGQQVRLGVYLKHDNAMRVVFGWDGASTNCFRSDSAEFMSVDDPDGARSVIMELYHSSKNFVLVPSCPEEARNDKFVYFAAKQRDYLKSMVAMKKIVHGKTKDVVILTLDSNVENFFKEDDREGIELACEEILKRLEFELLLLSIVTDREFQYHPCSNLATPTHQ